jgi:hypothetical protein
MPKARTGARRLTGPERGSGPYHEGRKTGRGIKGSEPLIPEFQGL